MKAKASSGAHKGVSTRRRNKLPAATVAVRMRADATGSSQGERPGARGSDGNDDGIFRPGAIVLVTLGSPREKFWGVLRELSLAGLSVCGLDLNSFDDFASLVKSGEPATVGAVFFPMHRIERIELDVRNGHALSLAERFHRLTGRSAAAVLGLEGSKSIGGLVR